MRAMNLDARDNQAIRDEIAERLRASLSRQQSSLPPRLCELLRRLDGLENRWSAGAASASIAALAGAGSWLHKLAKSS